MQYINYRENRRRGTADFPLEYYHVTASHPQYVMSIPVFPMIAYTNVWCSI